MYFEKSQLAKMSNILQDRDVPISTIFSFNFISFILRDILIQHFYWTPRESIQI